MIIPSPHFGEIIITGENAQAVADWLSKELETATPAHEMLAHRDAMLQFGVEVAATNSHVKDKENILHSLL